ncbi:proline dehydrogenase [Nocardia seriolae]|uniref:Proline dehydrogenase n=1 Tax=Nocardia seriolae TaxID=37332 RepID=A0ABC9YZY0_9NOCA|nr:hypothetical protein NSERKGN1266_60370 [Nocardia seriolae]BEK94080.1 hypothetical protein NSER024013_19860 [Nocardia seriolae]GAM48910.1 proline dehydrogenase [Nocardia seriolae]GAP30825.1 proline dehydrogenase [Nocardia seriolae]GEM26458.1 hypothetical protein NS2_46970 [Nocardia seriolae NBRC 15557]
MGLQAHGQPVRGGAGQAGAGAQLVEAAGLLGYGVQDGHGFVQNPDTAMLSHRTILASRMLGITNQPLPASDAALLVGEQRKPPRHSPNAGMSIER